MKLGRSKVKRVFSSVLVFFGQLYPTHRLPILLYHSVDNSGSVISISPEEFRAQMTYLKAGGYHTISLSKWMEYLRNGAKPRQRIVVLTFDDGFKNNYSEAFPVLRKYGFTATIFLVTNYIGSVFAWHGHKSIPQIPLLSWEEIGEMSDYGIDFGSHTCSHPYLTRLSQDEIKEELLESKSIIEARLNKPVRFFCHPYGDTNQQTQQVAEECGYLGAFGGLDFGLANSNENLYDLTRVGTAHFSSLQDFKAGLLGTYDWYIILRKIILRRFQSVRAHP